MESSAQGDQLAALIGSALARNTTLTSLNLPGVCVCVCVCVCVLCMYVCIYIANMIGDRGFGGLGTCIYVQCTYIYTDTMIGDGGFGNLADS